MEFIDFLTTIMLAFVVSLLLTSWTLWFYSIHVNLFKIYEELRKLNAKTATRTITTTTYFNNKSDIEKIAKEINAKLRRKEAQK